MKDWFYKKLKKIISMKKKHANFFILSILALMLLSTIFVFSRCLNTEERNGKNDSKKTNVKIEIIHNPELISKNTLRESPDTLIIGVTRDISIAPIEDIDKLILSDISISPSIGGEWKWSSDKTMTFKPITHWEVGKKYTISMKPTLFPENIKVINTKIKFKITSISLNINSTKFYINPVNPNIKKIKAEIFSNYPYDSNLLSDIIQIKITDTIGREFLYKKKDNIPFEITYDADTYSSYISTENLNIPKENVEVQILIKGELRTNLGGDAESFNLQSKITIPGQNTFIGIEETYINIIRDEQYNTNQIITFETRGKANPEEIAQYVSVHLLPKNRPKVDSLWTKIKYDYTWQSPSEVVPEVAALMTEVPVSAIPIAGQVSNMLSFNIDTAEKRQVLVEIKEGAPFYGNYKLARTYRGIVHTGTFPKVMQIQGDGTILRLNGDKKLSMFSQGISRAKIKIAKVDTDQIQHLISQSNGDIKNIDFRNRRFDEDNISQVNYSSVSLPSIPNSQTQFFSLDLADKIPNNEAGIFFLQFYNYNSTYEERFIMITDIGVWLKSNVDGGYVAFVQSISTGKPIENAIVSIMTLNGNTILSRNTNKDGHTYLPSFPTNPSNPSLEPVSFLIKKNNDYTFIPINNRKQRIDYSSFDIGGAYDNGDPKELKAYLFSDRSIYRPGDTANIGAIVKTLEWKKSKDLPLIAKIYGPSGSLIHEEKIKINNSGLAEFNYTSFDYSKTGDYEVNLYLIKKNGSYSSEKHLATTKITIKEFLPDTLNIQVSLQNNGVPSKKGWMFPKDLNAEVSLKNLFGSNAIGNIIQGEYNIRTSNIHFPEYFQYTFVQSYNAQININGILKDTYTNENGRAQFNLPLENYEQATYKLNVFAIGLEKGSGRNVQTEATTLISPLEFMIGFNPLGDLSYIHKDQNFEVVLIAVDPDLSLTSAKELTKTTYTREYVSSLVKLKNGMLEYRSIPKKTLQSKEVLTVPEKGVKLKIDSSIIGNYTIEIKNKDDIVVSTFDYSIIGDGNIAQSLNNNTELILKLDKKNYLPGETIEVYIQAPYKGSGYITIENNKVHNYKWFSMSKNSSVQYITLPKNLEGNAYINVMLSRSSSSPRIYSSPMSAGAIPFSIDRSARTHNISLKTPTRAMPGETVTISYKTETPADIILYGVDKGILQYGKYRTPDPLSSFFIKKALAINTLQNLNLVLSDYSHTQKNTNTGGGTDAILLARNLNPFKRRTDAPVVFWSKILSSSSQSRDYRYTIPDYFNGSIEVFAVAVSPDKIGVTNNIVTVQDNIVVQANIPLFIAPNDELEISAHITNLYENTTNTQTVTLITSKQIEIIGQDTQTLSIAKDKDGIAVFKIRAKEILGAADLEFVVKDNTFTKHQKNSISVRPISPYITRITTGRARKNAKIKVNSYDSYSELNTNDVSISYLPISLLKGLNIYLKKYPYGCTEQIVSKAFPYLALQDWSDFKVDEKERTEKIYHTIQTLLSRQNSDGSFNMWGGRYYRNVNEEYNIYAVHFLTEAIAQGYNVPEYMVEQAISYLKDFIKQTNTTYIERAYGIYVLSRNGIITTDNLNTLYDEINKNKDKKWLYNRSIPFIIASYNILKMNDTADKIQKRIAIRELFSFNKNVWDQFLYSSQYLYAMSKYSNRGYDKEELIKQIQSQLENNRYNSYNSSFTILAITNLLKNENRTLDLKSINGKEIISKNSAKDLILKGDLILSAAYGLSSNTLEFQNKTPDTSFYYQTTESGYEKHTTKESQGGLSVFSEIQKNKRPVTNFEIGEKVNLKVSYKSKNNLLPDLAFIVKIPSGMEINAAFSGEAYLRENRTIEYIEIREDRVVIYADATSTVQEIFIPLNIVNAGKVTMPPIFGKGMYDTSVYAVSDTETLVIESNLEN